MLMANELYHVFQPILNINKLKPIGFEALIRSKVLPNPVSIFRMAKESGQLYEFDCLSIRNAVNTYCSNGYTSKEGKLFLNILPSTILNKSFLPLIVNLVKDHDVREQEIVLEISESEKIQDFTTFMKRITFLKKLGFQIALDDAGSGYSDLKSFIELEPHYLKLDRYFANGLSFCHKKVELIRSAKKLCDAFNCTIIIEGIETEEDLKLVRTIGINYVQGYLLGKPSPLKSLVLA